jgi:hypothetical protein
VLVGHDVVVGHAEHVAVAQPGVHGEVAADLVGPLRVVQLLGHVLLALDDLGVELAVGVVVHLGDRDPGLLVEGVGQRLVVAVRLGLRRLDVDTARSPRVRSPDGTCIS